MTTFSLLALVATFTVASKSEVTKSGTMPVSTNVEYTCSYQKGSMRAGDSTVLEISGWQNIEIDKVSLSMKSNKTAGSGSLTMTLGEQTVWSIENSTFKDWSGQYTTSYTPIEHDFSPAQPTKGTIRIVIKGSLNSIYIESYSFTYHYAEARPYEVVLYAGQSKQQTLTETAIGGGVILPELDDRNGWHFVGWSEIQIVSTTSKPTLFLAGSVYYPKTDTELWAVYTDSEEQQVRRVQQVNCQSGYYAMAFSTLKMAYAGGVRSDGLVATKEVSLTTVDSVLYERQFDIADDMIYYIHCASDSTATIQHISSGTFLGYSSGKKFIDTDTEWKYQVLEDSTIAFYLDQDESGKVVVLGASYNRSENVLYGEPWPNMNKSSLVKSQVLLYDTSIEEQDIHYTTQIDKVDIQSVELLDVDHLLQVGIYQLHIKNGKKTLVLQ